MFPDLTTLNFAQFLFFALAAVGMTHIIVDSNLFAPVREFIKGRAETVPTGWSGRRANPVFRFVAKMIECYQCCGTWVGFFAAFWLLSWHPAVVFFGGCASSLLSYSAAVLLTYYESQSVVHAPKDQ